MAITGGSGGLWFELPGFGVGTPPSNTGLTIWQKVAATGDSGATFTLAYAQSNQKAVQWVIRVSDTGGTPSVGASSGKLGSSSASQTSNQISVATGSSVLAVFTERGATSNTWTAGTWTGTATGLTGTERDDQTNTGTSQVAAELQDGAAAATGGGTVTAAATAATAAAYCAGIVELVPVTSLTITYGAVTLLNSGAATGTVVAPTCNPGDLLLIVVGYGGGSPVLTPNPVLGPGAGAVLPPGMFAPLSRAFGPNPPFYVPPPVPPAAAPAVTSGPPVYPLGHPVQARQGPQRGGSVTSRDGTFAQTGPPVRPPDGPVRAQPAVPFLKGRTSSRAGVFGGTGPRVRPPDGPVQAVRPPVSQRSGRTTGRDGTYAGTGPPLRPPDGPVRVIPTLPPRGRAQGRTGAFTAAVPQAGPPVYPLGHPVQARRLPQRGGHVSRATGAYGGAGAPVRPPSGPVRAQPAPRRGGTVSSRAGTLTAGAPQAGPPVYPLGHPVRTRPQPPPRGRIVKAAGTYAGTGPPARPPQGPVGVSRRQPPPPTRGRTASQRGPYGQTGPPVIRARKPVRGQPARPVLTGRAAWRAGAWTAPFVPPFTIGALTATDAPGAVLTASGSVSALTASTAPSSSVTALSSAAGADSYPDIYYSDIYPAAPAAVLTATDQRTGGPG